MPDSFRYRGPSDGPRRRDRRAAAGAASAACSVRRQSPLVAEFEPSIRHDDLRLGQLCPVAVALVRRFQMSTLLRRLSGVTDTIAAFNAQMRRTSKNDLPWVISYLTGIMGLIWLAHMAGTHVHLLHAG